MLKIGKWDVKVTIQVGILRSKQYGEIGTWTLDHGVGIGDIGSESTDHGVGVGNIGSESSGISLVVNTKDW